MIIQSDLLEKIKELKPAHFQNAFSKFFTWQELENLLNLRPFVNAQRLTFLKDDARYEWPRQTWMTDVNCYPPTLIDQEIKGYHAYLSDASRVNKDVNAICDQLETALKGCADAHIYFNLTEDGRRGFGIHWDFSHNLIVQMEGETQMQIWNEEVMGARNMTMLQESPVIDVVMKPGDAVFVPMRTYHCATSLSKRLSVSFPISYDDSTPCQERHWIKI